MKDEVAVSKLLRLMGEQLDNAESSEGAALCYAETLLMVRSREGKLQRLIANPAQRAFEARKKPSNIVLKARQMGMTTWVAGQFFLRTITHPGTLTVLVAHTREAAEGIFGIVERFWENLPTDWHDGTLRRSRANLGQMVFPEIDSEFRVVSAGEENAGRGLTVQNLHLSEVARWPGDAQATLAGLRAALAPGGHCVLESTPAGAFGAFHEEWLKAAETGIQQHFFPWWLEPAYVAPGVDEATEAEHVLMTLHGLTPEQIGFRRSIERSFRGLRAQEYAEDAESCFRASGACCFPVEGIEERLLRVPAPVGTRRGGALQVWLPPAQRREYLLGVDTAGGGSDGDYAAIQVIERWTGLQCAELRERLAPLDLARVVAALAREYGNATVAVERNNHGAAVLAYLETVERYPHLYAQHGVAGWLTTAASKPAMISRLGALLEETPALFASRRLLTECRTFVTAANGRTAAAAGSHDDCLMAMAVAHAVRAETRQRTNT